ncbi:hypothetical protein T4B_5785 [Trichinella pseudospiralis]|uniref:Uncharacterized protein n=2 Tax=Trichinella pseudospiralis TaxID=6337 RepID=A0A0V1FC01_TRIPS|nr:hypothetical protein T4A_1026 [Trichinella pseudospiralis]KRY83590.1 hypothetical protein T4D_4127 [Trichinella pseudospiralis]KRZ23927.1 hypothetical protein T4B_5785 [Trichinella pseudospiralis]KRZ25059.1 hypothetical protein T4C_1010 [Trichinella pseudospiralis]
MKFVHLRFCLSGEALQLINGLNLTAESLAASRQVSQNNCHFGCPFQFSEFSEFSEQEVTANGIVEVA